VKIRGRRLKPWEKVARDVGVGFLLSIIVTAVWMGVAGDSPHLWELILITMGLLFLWDYIQHLRLRFAFEELVERYELHPAYGEDPEEFWGDRD